MLLYKSMFLTAFYAFLRVGEMTIREKGEKRHCLHLADIKKVAGGYQINFRSFKHAVHGTLSHILISGKEKDAFCPVLHLNNYLETGGLQPGNLFAHPSGEPVTRSQFTDALKGALSFSGLPFSLYKGHSFRIGAATWQCSRGEPMPK